LTKPPESKVPNTILVVWENVVRDRGIFLVPGAV
jgi:hypothetical protein